MSIIKNLIYFICISSCSAAHAGNTLEMKLAFPNEIENSNIYTFSNDPLPYHVEITPLLTEKDFLTANSMKNNDPAFGETLLLEISDSGLKKINKAANRSDYPGLGVFINNTPINIIQVIHPLDSPKFKMTGLSIEESKAILSVIGNGA